MKKFLLLTTSLVCLSAGGPAFADDDCYVPMSKWQPRAAVQTMAEAQGWNVSRIKIDDGCYEIKGFDPSGREIEVKIDPATLGIIEFEYEGDESDDNDEGDEGDEGNEGDENDEEDDYNDDDDYDGGDDDEGDENDEGDDDDDHRRHNAGPTTPVAPPANGLFVPGSKPKVISE